MTGTSKNKIEKTFLVFMVLAIGFITGFWYCAEFDVKYIKTALEACSKPVENARGSTTYLER